VDTRLCLVLCLPTCSVHPPYIALCVCVWNRKVKVGQSNYTHTIAHGGGIDLYRSALYMIMFTTCSCLQIISQQRSTRKSVNILIEFNVFFGLTDQVRLYLIHSWKGSRIVKPVSNLQNF